MVNKKKKSINNKFENTLTLFSPHTEIELIHLPALIESSPKNKNPSVFQPVKVRTKDSNLPRHKPSGKYSVFLKINK